MEGLLFLCFLCFLYFLPSLIGIRKRCAGAIFAFNFFLGWTVIGWVFALVVALIDDPAAPQGWRCAVRVHAQSECGVLPCLRLQDRLAVDPGYTGLAFSEAAILMDCGLFSSLLFVR
jgi:hypothetical protein